VLLHDEAMQEAKQDIQEAQDDNETLEDKDANSIIMARNNPRMAFDPLIKLPSPPDTWLPPLPKVDKGEPLYDEVDNPGDWQEYTYCAKFEKVRYKHHCSPTGAKPVPVNSDGERHMSGWDFHYKGWQSEVPAARDGATQGNLFPSERVGCLDMAKLRKCGISKERMVAEDSLLFHNLLLPMCSPSKSTIPDDGRHAYYTSVMDWTSMYAIEANYN
jgi:hypothetical protein